MTSVLGFKTEVDLSACSLHCRCGVTHIPQILSGAIPANLLIASMEAVESQWDSSQGSLLFLSNDLTVQVHSKIFNFDITGHKLYLQIKRQFESDHQSNSSTTLIAMTYLGAKMCFQNLAFEISQCCLHFQQFL